MNWYKKAQENTTHSKKFDSYYDIGHTGYNTGNHSGANDFLWIYIDGKIKCHPITSRMDVHSVIWNIDDNMYYGRFDKNNGMVSIINPFKGREIPNIILKNLYEIFGQNIRFIEFN